MSKEKKKHPLRFVRIHNFYLIPPYLVKQIKGREFDVDRFYNHGEMIQDSPIVFMYAMVDESHKIRGFLWVEINLLDQWLYVCEMSVDEEYRSGKGSLIDKAKGFLKTNIITPHNLKGIRTATLNPEGLEKLGWKRCEKIMMEV